MTRPVLPIEQQLPDILGALSTHASVVLQAEPGAGKSTVLPLALLEADFLAGQTIVMLEPRRVAAKTIAHYLAKQLGEDVGQTVGYQVRNDRRHCHSTRLEIVTEGILTRRLQADPELPGVGLVIFDEFHERSLQTDLSLMLCHEVQQALRDDLKILVMSATVDADHIAGYLGEAAIVHCPGRAHAVETEQLSQPGPRELPKAIVQAISRAQDRLPSGDLLVFLPGKREIDRAISAALDAGVGKHFDCLPLYGGLSLAEQERVLSPSNDGRRRVIFSTNIAETSLTIPGIVGVVDSGLERRVRYDPVSDMTRLETVRISKASAAQRSGRAGRLGPGWCWRLWPTAVHQQLRDFQPEDIIDADLADVVLELHAWGLTQFDNIPWITPPPVAHYNAAVATLTRLGVISVDASSGDSKLTALAAQITSLGVHPRIGAMLTQARELASDTDDADALGVMACYLAALLADRDIFTGAAGVDLDTRLMALLDYETDRKRALAEYPLHRGAVADTVKTAQQLVRRLTRRSDGRLSAETSLASGLLSGLSAGQRQQWLAELLLLAYPDRVARRRGETARYLVANGKGVTLPDGDSLFGSQWLIVVEWDGQQSDGRIFRAAAVSEADITAFIQTRSRSESRLDLSEDGRRISRRTVHYYDAILVREDPPAPLAADELMDYLPELFRLRGLALLNWSSECAHWLARASWLAQQIADFPKINEDILVASVDAWLLPYVPRLTQIEDLKRLPSQTILNLAQGQLTFEQQQQLEREAPACYLAPSGKSVPIRYEPDQPPTVAIQLQELFGELASPRLGGGAVPLRFELLSPARRPVQTTSDLEGFWRGSYFDVAKDMRGRYPKHRWPEKPLEEKPGKSIKTRR